MQHGEGCPGLFELTDVFFGVDLAGAPLPPGKARAQGFTGGIALDRVRSMK
jgi:hypothetical protein